MKPLDLLVGREDKIALVGPLHNLKTAFFEAIMSDPLPAGIQWGQTITTSYFPKENADFFNNELNMIDWLRQYSPVVDESYVRGFLGRMLFSGEESLKLVKVLSGGEKVRCMLSRLMLSGANTLILDEPTNHLDLESITALQDGLNEFKGVVIFNCHDHEFTQGVANRIIEFTPNGLIDRQTSFDEYLVDPKVKALREELWGKG